MDIHIDIYRRTHIGVDRDIDIDIDIHMDMDTHIDIDIAIPHGRASE